MLAKMPSMDIIHEEFITYDEPTAKQEIHDFQKPLIYVTHPDDMEDEIWVPPAHEYSSDSSDSESDTDESDTEPPLFHDISHKSTIKDDVLAQTQSVRCEDIQPSAELWFYRTGWQNRGVYTADAPRPTDMTYFADIPWRGWGSHLTVRKSSGNGPIVAESHRRGPRAPFELTFTNPVHRSRLDGHPKIVLRYGNVYSRAHRFRYAGRNLAWRHGAGVRRLRDVDSGEVIAEFSMRPFSLLRDGRMEIWGEAAGDEGWKDVIVVTALTCQQREREIRRAAAYAAHES